jgi:hypothetical protein
VKKPASGHFPYGRSSQATRMGGALPARGLRLDCDFCGAQNRACRVKSSRWRSRFGKLGHIEVGLSTSVNESIFEAIERDDIEKAHTVLERLGWCQRDGGI